MNGQEIKFDKKCSPKWKLWLKFGPQTSIRKSSNLLLGFVLKTKYSSLWTNKMYEVYYHIKFRRLFDDFPIFFLNHNWNDNSLCLIWTSQLETEHWGDIQIESNFFEFSRFLSLSIGFIGKEWRTAANSLFEVKTFNSAKGMRK